jgi:anti-sigma factor RsiW
MDAANHMACRELVQLVTDYLDDALTDDDQRRFEEHLAECPDCVTFVDQFRSTIVAVGHLATDAPVPPETRDALLAAFRGWVDTPPSGS